jgi:inosine/xanthosine triphosphatase
LTPLFHFLLTIKEDGKMKIIIGSKNPVKVKAVKQASHGEQYEYKIMDVSSGVSEQPFSDQETITGAINRAENALSEGQGQIGIGLEGGVHETEHGLFLCNWGALASIGESPIVAGGARILLPLVVANRLRNGEKLGPVMDDYVQKQNISINEGAIGVFTNGLMNRTDMFTHITQLLLGQYLFRQKTNYE